MKLYLEVEDTTSPTAGDPDIAVRLLNEIREAIGTMMSQLDPDHHEWVTVEFDKP